MPVVLAISRSGTLDGAAEQLNVNRTTIGRRLKVLEQKIGGNLFVRLEGRYELTALGRELLAAAEAAEVHLMAVEGILPEQTHFESGPLRIAIAPHILPFIAPLFLEIARNLPQFRLQISSSYAKDEVAAREADIAIRIQKLAPKYPLYARKLKRLPGALFQKKAASTSAAVHISRPGEAEIPSGLIPWPADIPEIEIDDILGKQEMIAAGGVGRLPIFMGDNDGRLERLSDRLPDAGWSLWLVSHEAFKSSGRVKRVMAEIQRSFAQDTRL